MIFKLLINTQDFSCPGKQSEEIWFEDKESARQYAIEDYAKFNKTISVVRSYAITNILEIGRGDGKDITWASCYDYTSDKIGKPINWKNIVDETIRRRKAKGMNQREHAILAGVCEPTARSFARYDPYLSLESAFKIMRVFDMVEEDKEI